MDDGGESDGDEEHGEDSGDDDEQQVAMYNMYGISGVNLGNYQLDILYNRGGGEALRKSMLIIDHGTSNTLGAAITCFKVHSSTGRTPYLWTHSDWWTSMCGKSYRPHWGVLALIFVSYGRATSSFARLPRFVLALLLPLYVTHHSIPQWDVLLRCWHRRKNVQNIGLLIADEIQLVGNEVGPTCEVVISRTRYIYIGAKRDQDSYSGVRCIFS